MTKACPSDRELERLLSDQLSAAQEQELEGHVAGCPACQERLDLLTACDPTLPALAIVNAGPEVALPVSAVGPPVSPPVGRDATPRPMAALTPLAGPASGGPAASGGSSRLSGSAALRATGTFLRRRVWAWPLIAALFLGVAGWLVKRSVEDALQQQRVEELNTILDADLAALHVWMDHQRATAELFAQDEQLRPLVQELVAPAPSGPATAPDPGFDHETERRLAQAKAQAKAQAAIRSRLHDRLKERGYIGFVMVTPAGVVIAAEQDAPLGKALAGYRKDFFEKVIGGRAAVSKPFVSPLLLAGTDGVVRANLPAMFAAAPVRDDTGKPLAALGLRIRPEGQFTRILHVARSGGSGETYAFDKNGLLLSQSRFDEQLKQIGLLVDQPDSQSILTVEVRDPQVDMTQGVRPRTRRPQQPLTRMAADAVQGKDGYDAEGYRDYRGVPVVGAWRWLDEYDFGVATEIDVAEAFRPVLPLRRAFIVLLALLILSAGGIFLAMTFIDRQQRALQKAALEAKQLGQYTLLAKIGSGGMGTVYKARHAMLRRPTAVKLLDVDKMSHAALVRFEREVQLTSALTHPNTVAIFDYGRTPEGIFYYAMEYLDGINLDDLVERHGPLPEARLVYILTQVCAALAEAHAAGLVHRDIKPANIFLTCRGGSHDFVKVLDFGLVKTLAPADGARVTSPDVIAGTPHFLAPEAVSRPTEVDVRADVYAVGAVGYFLLTGAPVFQGTSAMDICLKHVHAAPEPPSARCGRPVSADLEALLLRCLAKTSAERCADAAALLDELSKCAVEGSWTARDAAAWWTTRGLPIATLRAS